MNPVETYVKASKDGANYILAKALATEVLGDDIEIIEEYKGKDLEYRKYESLYNFIETKEVDITLFAMIIQFLQMVLGICT